MEYRYGIAVSPGVAIGPALVLDTEGVLIPHRTVPPGQVEAEVARLNRALDETAASARDAGPGGEVTMRGACAPKGRSVTRTHPDVGPAGAVRTPPGVETPG